MRDRRASRQIAAAVDALRVSGPTRYKWMGEPFDLSAPVRRLASPEGLRAALVQAITQRLYADFYSSGQPVAPRSGVVALSRDGSFARSLSAANAGAGAVETGWRYTATDGARLVVERRGLRLWADPADVAACGPEPLREGDLVTVRMDNESLRLSPGFYMAFGDVGLDPGTPRLFDQFYLHVRADSAAHCMDVITRRLNAAHLPFRFKILDDPAFFDRCDTGVLTLQRRQRAEGVEHVRALHDELAPGLEDAIPALTLPLAPGVGFAENPLDGSSFGVHRCRLLAEALLHAHDLGYVATDERLDAVRTHFDQAGVSLETPHLGPLTAGDPRAFAEAVRSREEVPGCR